MVEKVNAELEGSRKGFGASLKSEAGLSVSSMLAIRKLELLQSHYEGLGKVGVDDNFEADRKE